MKKCTKCGFELADTARFCHKCGEECATKEVKRKPEGLNAGQLIGDKNLINDSTIIGTQEKYEASNITIHNNITEDHSHTTLVCAVSGKRVYLDKSVVCPGCGHPVALEYYVEATKRCENCERKAHEEYRTCAQGVMGGGRLDAARKAHLDAEARRLRIDDAMQTSILRSLQQNPHAEKSAELSSVQRAELDTAVKRLITASDAAQSLKSLELLSVIHENTTNFESDFWYFLVRAIVEPAESVKSYEEELSDNYWQRYWGFLAYCNTGSAKGGAAVDRLGAVFGEREDDIRLAEVVYYLARGFDSFEQTMLDRAGELSALVRPDYLSKPLSLVYAVLQRLVTEGVRIDGNYSPEELFVIEKIFRAGTYIKHLCKLQAHREEEAREAQAREEQRLLSEQQREERERLAEEQVLREKQAEMAANHTRRMEQEVARLGGAKPVAETKSQDKAFAGYETTVPGKKKRNGKRILLIVVVCILVLLGLLFLIPAPESFQ